MSQRVLIVSPHFPPVNAADHQRVRMALPYLKEFGWSATVLAIDPREIEGVTLDPLLDATVPGGVEVHRVPTVPAAITRLAGLGNLAMRSLPYLWRAGNKLLRRAECGVRSGESEIGNPKSEIENRRFDLVFFSTTQFPVMILGATWKRKFGVPYVVDFQDPWLDDYYKRTGITPPGGKARHTLSRTLAAQLEPRVMRNVSQVISVSPAYVEILHARYPQLRADQFTVLPFGAPERDFELLPKLQLKHSLFDAADGNQHWLYVGRAGNDMAAAFRLLFSTMAELRRTKPREWKDLRLHFVGTSYAPVGRAVKTVEPIVVECGIGDLVREQTARVPYFEALQALTEADALLVTGSDSPSYTASKLYPYMLANRPMLSVLHEQSPAVEILRRCNAGEVVTFHPARPEAARGQMSGALLALLQRTAEGGQKSEDSQQINRSEFNQYTAREMTRKMCAVFDRAVEAKLEGESIK